MANENWNRVMDASRCASQIRSLAIAASSLTCGPPPDKELIAVVVDYLLSLTGMLAERSLDVLNELEKAH